MILASCSASQEMDKSYYQRQMKSCEYNERKSFKDYMLYVPNNTIDYCCADSVGVMQSVNGKQIDKNKECPEGSRKVSLKCETSKTWCEKI